MRSEDMDSEDRERRDNNSRPFTATSPTQSNFHSSTYSPNGAPLRAQYINPYNPTSPSPIPIPASSHILGSQASPYQSEYQPVPRDKPSSGYYDPTSDSIERRPSENTAWSEAQNTTSQVREYRTRLAMARFVNSFLTSFSRLENHTSIHRPQLSNLHTTTVHIPRPLRQVFPLGHQYRMATHQAR